MSPHSAAFRDDHLVPMASALWSSPSAQILKFPAKYLVAFMANHQMMVTGDRKPWRLYQNYLLDWLALRLGRVDDGVMRFGRGGIAQGLDGHLAAGQLVGQRDDRDIAHSTRRWSHSRWRRTRCSGSHPRIWRGRRGRRRR